MLAKKISDITRNFSLEIFYRHLETRAFVNQFYYEFNIIEIKNRY